MQKKWFLAGVIFFVSRLVFINFGPVFFDSPAYLRRFADPLLLHALRDGHFPLHIGYILFGWPLYSLASNYLKHPEFAICLFQIFLWIFASYSFYNLVLIWFKNKKTALLSLLYFSLTPLLWITQVTIMMDSLYVALFIIAWYLYMKGSETAKYTIRYYMLASIILLFSLLTHFAGFVFFPALIFSVIFFGNQKNKRTRILFFTFLSGSVFIYIVCNIFLMGIRIYAEGIYGLYHDKAQLTFGIHSILVFIRNAFIPVLRSNTVLLSLIAFLGFITQFRKNFKLFVLGFLILAPMIFINQWWDSLLMGRHALLGTVGIAMFGAIFVTTRPRIALVSYLYLLIAVIPALFLLRSPIPYIQIQNEYTKIPGNSLYIESHFARPQIQIKQHTEVVFLDEPGWNTPLLSDRVDEALDQGRRVFVSSQALSEPYGLYSGPYLHPISLSYKKEFILFEELKGKYSFKEFSVMSKKDNLILYEINKRNSSEESIYPYVPRLIGSSRRIDYFDPIIQLWLKLK